MWVAVDYKLLLIDCDFAFISRHFMVMNAFVLARFLKTMMLKNLGEKSVKINK